MELSTHVTKTGPIFDGRAMHAVKDFMDDATKTVADEGVKLIRTELGHVLKHPTGRYQSHIHAVRSSIGHDVVDDRVVYGPWLEGTGSRNRTTRFKGYATFRRMTQQLQRKAGDIAERVLQHYIGKMN